MKSRLSLIATAFMLVTAATAGIAQTTVNVDTLTAPEFGERSSWENGFLNRFGMDRVPIGPRLQGMGGAGLALLSGPEYATTNPASILGVLRPELQAEFKIFSGGAGVASVPDSLVISNDQTLTATNYRIRPREVLDYHSLSFGMPITLLGRRGAVALTYRRVSATGSQDETRVELRGPVTNEAEATWGLGDLPEDGMDAVSVAVAREMADFLDLGVNLNWQSGTLVRKRNIGLAVFGFQFLDSFTEFSQDVSAFNVDLGGRLEVGPVQLGGAVYLDHDLEFKNGKMRSKPVGDPQDPGNSTLILSSPHDHTVRVPFMYSLGAAYQPTEDLTLAADFWARPWTKATVTRTRIEPFVGFADPDDPDSFEFLLIPANNDSLWALIAPSLPDPENKTETFNAGLDNTHSLRIGLEYLFINRETFGLPVRFGFRRENVTYNNTRMPVFAGLPDTLNNRSTDYLGLIDDYYEAIQNGDPLAADIERQLKEIAERNHEYFRGESVSTSAFTFGIGVRWHDFEADLTLERISYDYNRFFLNDFDPLTWPLPAVAEEDRALMNISFATRMRF